MKATNASEAKLKARIDAQDKLIQEQEATILRLRADLSKERAGKKRRRPTIKLVIGGSHA